MNAKATQWLRLAKRLHEHPSRRGDASSKSAQTWTKEFSDVEIADFLETRKAALSTPDGCLRLEVEAVYQSVLSSPEDEEKILEQAGFLQDERRQQALYRHAEDYTRELERLAAQQERLVQANAPTGFGRFVKLLVLFIALVGMSAGGWVYLQVQGMRNFLKRPTGAADLKGEVIVDIPRGATAELAIQKLKEARLIEDEARFHLLTRFYRVWKSVLPELKDSGDVVVRAGRYKMKSDLTPLQVLEELRKGPPRFSVRVTLPEGFNIWKIAARLESREICRAQDFLRYAQNASYVSRLIGWQAPSAEGYLYPDTYKFHKNSDAQEVLTRMLRRFQEVFRKNFASALREKEAIRGMAWDPHKLITLASIIEKETGKGFERPQISMVFHNRLRRNWKLETDPTVIYGLMPNFNGNITSKDLHNPHPYNTYKHRGLPPGPIASPGFDAIRSSLFPRAKRTCIIFFVSKNDGTHVFSCTKQEHERWVDIYQRKIRRPPPRE